MNRRPTVWWTPSVALLSAQGLERALVTGVALLKLGNVILMVLQIAESAPSARRPWLEVLSGVAFVAAGTILVAVSARAASLHPRAVLLDVVVSVGTIAVTPLFRPVDPGVPWTEWANACGFLVAAEACVVGGLFVGLAAAAAMLAAGWSWTFSGVPLTTRQGMAASSLTYLAYLLASALFVHYLRRLAALADARQQTITVLAEEHRRRVLHTPYRLLGDLAALLAAQDPDDARRPRIAEAMASVREIEAIVRGTEPASTNLATELHHLHEQFADLPLLINVEDVGVDLPAAAVYRIREAVRSALQNVRRYAHAGEVVVYASANADEWLVSVHDDGVGFDPATMRPGVGLADLVFGALQQAGADVSLTSAPGEGTLLELRGDHRWRADLDPAGPS